MPGYGYRDAERDRKHRPQTRSSSESKKRKSHRSDRADKNSKKEKKRRRDDDRPEPGSVNGSRSHKSDRVDKHAPPTAHAAPTAHRSEKPAARAQVEFGGAAAPATSDSRRSSWRDELETTKKGDDDDMDECSGYVPMETDEDVERKIAESRARREALIAKWVNRGEDGALEAPNTAEEVEDDESDGEVAAFFAARAEAEKRPENDEDLEKKKALNRFILQSRAEHDGDMFDEGVDANKALNKKVDQSAAIGQTGASGDDWNDAEGYYKAKIGEVMADRYLVVEDKCGQGVFSTVVKAKDTQNKDEMVAIKIMRCNDMMKSAAEKEVAVLQRINGADKGNKRNVIRLLRSFMYRDHLCLVFECMWDNLRVAMKKYTKDKGMSLRAVRAYTKQLLVALQHIHRCGVIHADIKPDNILISAGQNVTKICDLGSAVELTEIEITPYLVSRFYRAPEIVLGAKYGTPSDTFAMGATLCELFTGKILFPGRSNNDMLRCYMELKGKPPKSFIKSGHCWKQHFDENLDFMYVEHDKVTRKKRVKTITDCSAKRSILDLIMARLGPEKPKSSDPDDQLYVKKAKQFADLIGHMTTLDPEKRYTPEQCLKHPFVTEHMPSAKPGANAQPADVAK